MKSAYEIAKEGGRHKGLYERNKNVRSPEIEKSIRSLFQQIKIHEEKIVSPLDFVRSGIPGTEISYLVESYWPKEILKFKESISVLQGVLKERK